MKNFFDILGEYGKAFIDKYNRAESYVKFKNGSTVYFIDLENETKVTGIEIGFFFVDEAKEITFDIFQALVGRLRQPNTPLKGMLATNPDTPLHWLYKMFYEDKVNDKNYYVVEASSNQNVHLPESYLESMQDAYSGQYADRYILGKWILFEGLVYDEFNPSFVSNIEFGDRLGSYTFFRCIDWGYTNPAVCLFCAIDEDRNFYIFDEIYQKGLTLTEFIEIIKSKHKDKHFTYTFADPSEPSNIRECIENNIYTEKAINDISNGIQLVKRNFTQGKITIDRKCANLIRELQTYRWEEHKEGKEAKEKPLKLNDHACDALRYGIATIENRFVDAVEITISKGVYY